jgi:hypothetical protein
MAILRTKGLSGRIGGEIVFKQYANKTVVTATPDKCRKPPSELQLLNRECFRRARKRASMDKSRVEIADVCKSYLKPGQSLYHFLIGVYVRQERRMLFQGGAVELDISTILREEMGIAKQVFRRKRKETDVVKRVGMFNVVKKEEEVNQKQKVGGMYGFSYTVNHVAWVSTTTLEMQPDASRKGKMQALVLSELCAAYSLLEH